MKVEEMDKILGQLNEITGVEASYKFTGRELLPIEFVYVILSDEIDNIFDMKKILDLLFKLPLNRDVTEGVFVIENLNEIGISIGLSEKLE